MLPNARTTDANSSSKQAAVSTPSPCLVSCQCCSSGCRCCGACAVGNQFFASKDRPTMVLERLRRKRSARVFITTDLRAQRVRVNIAHVCITTTANRLRICIPRISRRESGRSSARSSILDACRHCDLETLKFTLRMLSAGLPCSFLRTLSGRTLDVK